MAVKYDFFKIPDLVSEGKTKYSARTILSGEVDMERIADVVASRCTMKQADVRGVWDAMLRIIKEELQNGKRIHLDGLCYLNLSAQSPMVRSTKEIRAESILCRDIKYRTEKELKRTLRHTRFERQSGKHSSEISDIEIDGILREYFKYNAYITRKEFARLCKLSPTTAMRKIKDLVQNDKLSHPGSRNSGFYFPVPGGYISNNNIAAR